MAPHSRSGTAIAVLVFAAMIAGIVFRYWPGEERSIRRHLTNLAEALSFPAVENEVQRITRMRALREYFMPDVRLTLDGQEIRSGDALVDRLSHVEPPPGGIVVEFSDLVVALADDEETARVTLTVQVLQTPATSTSTVVDVRAAVLAMTRQPGDWVIAEAEANARN